ncbi:MAG TPA: hypothetical protein VGL86_28715 [Polyangia bacterium]|jgi:hypothetical protein
MSIMRFVMVAALAAAAAGCGNDDCSGQSVPHCPSTSAAQCIDGHFQCVALDMATTGAVFDIFPPATHDLSQPGD